MDNNMNGQVVTEQQVQQPKKTNVLCVIGLVLSFLLSPVGLILSIIGVVQANKKNEEKVCGIIGIVVGVIGTIIQLIVIIFVVFAFSVFSSVGTRANIILSTACSNIDSHGDYTGDEDYEDGNVSINCSGYECTIRVDGKEFSKICNE